jgi:hypothetical protein
LFHLLPLVLASHSFCSYSCMSRSSVYLGLDSSLSRDRSFRVSFFVGLVCVPWHPCILKVTRNKFI